MQRRNEIIEIAQLTNAGSTTRTINELMQSGFIRDYMPFGGGKNNGLYKLLDFFFLCYNNPIYRFKHFRNIFPAYLKLTYNEDQFLFPYRHNFEMIPQFC